MTTRNKTPVYAGDRQHGPMRPAGAGPRSHRSLGSGSPGAAARSAGRSGLRHGVPCASLLLAALLAGCASTPPQGGAAAVARQGPAPASERDGPDAQPPRGLASVPDAEPRVEPIRVGGPNKPYEVLGREYVPLTADIPYVERGLGSWYGRKFHGRRTSSGELYNMYEMTAAHPTLPIPSYALVRNPANAREVVVRINDRGPFHPGRIVDLSYTAALKLDLLRGVAPVEVERITHDQIRSGAWRRGGSDTLLAARPASAATPIAPAPAPPPAPTPTVSALGFAPAAPVPVTLLPVARLEPAQAAASAPTTHVAAVATEPAPSAPPQRVEDAPRAAAAALAEPKHRAYTKHAQGFWVQIGAFRERSGAEAFQRRVATEVDWLAPLLAIFNETAVHRLQAGPYASREEAGSASQRIRQALQLMPVIVERR